VLGILNSCQSLRDLGQFANLHCTSMTSSLGIDLKRSLSDTAFRYFFLTDGRQVAVRGHP
jgi:hypothetical protein